jgi:hypothetical protein
MDSNQQLRAADALTELWKGLLPDDEAPSKTQFLTWAAMCSENIAAYALNRAARKAYRLRAAGSLWTSEQLGRYVTSIMKNERDGRHIFDTPQARGSGAVEVRNNWR